MTEFLVKFFGVLAGVVARSLLPWLRKLRDHEIQGFDRRYLISAIASFIICFIISLLIFPQFTPPPLITSPDNPPPSAAKNSIPQNPAPLENPSSSPASAKPDQLPESDPAAEPDQPSESGPTAKPGPARTTSTPFEAYFKLFCLAFGFGFGFDGLIKEAGQWVRLYRRRPPLDSGS